MARIEHNSRIQGVEVGIDSTAGGFSDSRRQPGADPGRPMRSEAGNSFEELALPHIEALFRIARRLTRDEHEAEDLLQEVFLKAHKAFGRFEMREFGIRPWLLRILHNSFLNRQARARQAPRSTDAALLDRVVEDNHSTVRPPELDYENLDQEVKRAIDELSPEFRSVLLFWATMEMSYQQIADTLRIPIGTVMSRLHRAREQLVQALGGYAREHRLTDARAGR